MFAAAAAAVAQAGKAPADPKQSKVAPASDYEVADDVKEVPARELHAQGDVMKRYFLIGAPAAGKVDEKAPPAGDALLLVMPGGDGSAQMTSFLRRVQRDCCPKGWLVAELVAARWPGSEVIWPTRQAKVAGAKFTTEEFVDAVLADVTKTQKVKIDPARVYQLGWSSGGPAEYAIALQEKPPVTASYIAMSVFFEAQLDQELKNAKGRAFFLDHSPDDTTCKFENAEKAQARLKREGARVELVTYQGGHGWNDAPFARMQQGFAWMEKNHAKPERK
jgi:predicted esterase